MYQKGETNLTIPIAIVVAGVLIAAAVFIANSDGGTNTANNNDGNNGNGTESEEIELAPITEDDHILGNPDADIVIVEYSDTECPYCKEFHNTMHTVIDEFGQSGRVAWVYRHLPLDGPHPKARTEAEATECAADLGGNDAFWSYIDRLFEVTPSNNQLDLDQLPEIAEEVGLDRNAFEECMDSGRTADAVEDDLQSARAAGASGTPHSIILLTGSGETFPMPGNRSVAEVRSIIGAGLNQIDGAAGESNTGNGDGLDEEL